MLDASDERAADIAQAFESYCDDVAMLFREYGREAVVVIQSLTQGHVANEYDIEIELVADPQSLN